MKLSTKKIIAIGAVTLGLVLALALLPTPAVLRSYLQVAVLVGAIGASIILLGWAKPRGEKIKLLSIVVILATVVAQLMIFLLLGIKLGWVRNVYAWNFTSLFTVFLPLILAIIGEEILRGQMVEKGRNSLAAVCTAGICLWLVESTICVNAYNLSEAQGVFSFLAIVVGPSFLKTILLTYIAVVYDYRINIAYRFIMELPFYLLPVLPDAGPYLPVLFQIGVVLLLAIWLVSLRKTSGFHLAVAQFKTNGIRKLKKRETEGQRKIKQAIRWCVVGVVAVAVVSYVALISGLFKYHFLAIGSGSMEPNIYRGDMILVEKSQNYNAMNEGDILVYRHSNVIMVHRITEIIEQDGHYVFQTKGDANNSNDAWVVDQSDVIGITKSKIATLGYPTLWLNELFNGGEI